jgi:hypothetical protein
MRILITLLTVLFAVTLASAQGAYIKRLSNTPACIAETGSYTYVRNITVASADFTVPDSIIIFGICVDSAGTVLVKTSESDSVSLTKPDAFCYPIRITKVYSGGTTTALRASKISIFGWKKN